jgi:addiction module RelB/DinJ family antitoxin
MTATNISIYTDSELAAKAQSVLAGLGMDMSTAVTLFLTQVVDKETLPIEGSKPEPAKKKIPRSEAWGCMKGKIWMSDDFDAPLCFEEDIGPTNKTPKLGGWEGRGWIADDFNAPMEEFKEYM